MINCDDISYFKKILGERGVVQEEEKLDDANMDWMRKYRGSSKLMLQPKSTQEVSVFIQLNLLFFINWFLYYICLLNRSQVLEVL